MTNARLIQKILVATDGSEPSLKAAQFAAEIAKCHKAEVTIIYAAEAISVTEFARMAFPLSEPLSKNIHETGMLIIERAKKPFLEADIDVRSKIIEGYAADVILEEAKSGNYDLIAMGSRGASGALRRVFLGVGSVAERVLGSAPCPVLVARTS
ncbi:MAG: universal stress protein [Armatimonadota bacterium]|nr:universal stress protein [Armatimonadota bacterium]